MSITPIKSSITATPTSRDVSAVIRSIRGSFVNMSSDQSSRLQVAVPTNIFSLPNITEESAQGHFIFTDEPYYDAGSMNYIRAQNAQDNMLCTCHNFCGTPNRTLITTQRFRFLDENPTSDGTRRWKIGLFNPYFDNGMWLERSLVGNPSTETVSLNYKYSSFSASILQADWNVDTLRIESDIAKNPSRCQIDWTKDVELCVFSDLPNSILFGFTYDGVFLPAHRMFSESSGSAYISPIIPYPLGWQVTTTVAGGVIPAIKTMLRGCSVSLAGNDPIYSRDLSTDYRGLVTVPAGSLVHVLSVVGNYAASTANTFTPILKNILCYSSGPALALVTAGSSPTLGHLWAECQSPGTVFYNTAYQSANRGALTSYGRIIAEVPFSGAMSVGDFGLYSFMGNYLKGQSSVITRDSRDLLVANPGASDITVLANMTLGYPY